MSIKVSTLVTKGYVCLTTTCVKNFDFIEQKWSSFLNRAKIPKCLWLLLLALHVSRWSNHFTRVLKLCLTNTALKLSLQKSLKSCSLEYKPICFLMMSDVFKVWSNSFRHSLKLRLTSVTDGLFMTVYSFFDGLFMKSHTIHRRIFCSV